MYSQVRVQQQWNALKILHHDAVVYGNGNVILGDCYYSKDDDGNIHYQWQPLCDTTIESIETYIDNKDDCWVSIDIYRSEVAHGEGKIVCGDGAMGNEGFVACVDAMGKLNWSIFFDFSNPIIKVEKIGEKLICHGDTGIIVRIDLKVLHNIDIEYHFF